MIPSIETILNDLGSGLITKAQAIAWLYEHASGATNDLRDAFAMEAMNAMLVDNRPYLARVDSVAKDAYVIADAMMSARVA